MIIIIRKLIYKHFYTRHSYIYDDDVDTDPNMVIRKLYVHNTKCKGYIYPWAQDTTTQYTGIAAYGKNSCFSPH